MSTLARISAFQPLTRFYYDGGIDLKTPGRRPVVKTSALVHHWSIRRGGFRRRLWRAKAKASTSTGDDNTKAFIRRMGALRWGHNSPRPRLSQDESVRAPAVI